MKLATLRDGSRDGQLAVVSRDLTLAHFATGIAGTMRQLLDDWNFISPQLEDLSATLNGGKARHAFAFEPQRCLAPLPRCSLHLLGPSPRAGDAWLGPAAPLHLADPADLAAGVHATPALAAIVGDVAAGADTDSAREAVRLLLLCCDWGLPGREPGSPQAAPGTSCAAVALTPDELGEAWQRGRLRLPLALGRPGAAATRATLAEDFGLLISQAAATRALGAGSVIGQPFVDADGRPAVITLADTDADATLHLALAGGDGAGAFGPFSPALAPARAAP